MERRPPLATQLQQRLEGCEFALDAFLGQCQQLGDHLGCLLVQLASRDRRFFELLRQRHAGPVAASPSRFAADAHPAGWPGLVYWRLHGEPRIYHSEYSQQYLQQLAERLQRSHAAGEATWCIFDNTASGAALGNALALERYLR
ncbi:DUF72 domain-containing protein [Pseudomonas sp. 10-1B]|uniref:DUF72 domain-containing protein n=1 Tax=Pseudomonas sp. 10-1B TaxID=1546029 RepID=UPI0009E51C1E|nr:DUF72 domain-containing protein [Pseudomonas sp. 10-1B]